MPVHSTLGADGKIPSEQLPTVTPGPPGGATAWGAITGTLSAQTDLATALAGKGSSNFDGAYSSLSGKPALGTAAAAATTAFDASGAAASAQAASLPLHGKADTAGAADSAVTLAAGADRTKLDGIAAGATVGAPNASYRTLLDSSGSHTAAKGAGTYGLGQGVVAAVTGTGTLYPLNTIAIAAADYPTVNGLAAKLRVRFNINANDVAPFTGTFVCGFHPVTRPATSGGAGLVIYTIGTAVTGSTVTLTNPAADSANQLVGADFALPADGQYILAFVTNATMATSSHVHISASLQLRNA